MKFSNRIKFSLISLLLILNIILRFQVVPQEIGWDSFIVHMMSNSISEFGYAKWILHVSSFFGMYPYSEVSAVPFFLSGIFQVTNMEMGWVVFYYSIFLSILSILTAYLMAGAIVDDDVFKFMVAFVFSTSQAVVDYSTWTVAARGLFVMLAPLLIYMLLKCRGHLRFIPLIIFFAVFLYSTHHMIYFFIPAFVAIFILLIVFKFKDYLKIPAILLPIILIAGFFLMFSIPFITGKFVETSKYSPIYEAYIRYVGPLIILGIGGLIYLIFKQTKNFIEWFLLLTTIFLTALVYEETYMKWFLPIFLVTFACIGLLNILKLPKKRPAMTVVAIFLIINIGFSGYYQFLHFSPSQGINERYIEDTTYTAGKWMKEYVKGSAISNDVYFGYRMAATSENVHHLVPYTLLAHTYGFGTVNLSKFQYYPITSENFWFNVGEEIPDFGEDIWSRVNTLDHASPSNFNITFFAENTMAKGRIIWGHGQPPSKLLRQAYNQSFLVYDGGKVRVWELNEVK